VRLHAYAAKHNLGVSALAHRTGIQSGILSPWFAGTYPGSPEAIAERVERFFWRLEQKAKYGGIRTFVETRLARALWALFEKTRVVRRIQLVESPEQLGKTEAAREYTSRNNAGRTVYVSMSGVSRSGFGDFIWNLADALNIPYTIKLREKKLRIRHAIEACDLLIIDEAHVLWSWTDRSAAEFWDYLRTDLFQDGHRGIVLIATQSDMLRNIKRFGRRAGYNTGQLLGRMRNRVERIDPVDDITEADVALLVGRYYQPGKRVVANLTRLAQADEGGHFGLVCDILNEAWAEARARKTALSDAIVKEVAESVMENLGGKQ
jgi:hypothetical protein